jgi:hypothetical protein
MDEPDARDLVGSSPADRWGLRACETESYLAMAAGIWPYDWEHPARVVPNPPEIDHGPFTELHLAPSPEAALVGAILRLRKSSDQSIRQIVKDVRMRALYRVRAPGVRIKDGAHDAELAQGLLGLRREGEQTQDRLADRALAVVGGSSPDESADERGASIAWAAVAAAFDESIAALEMPDEGVHPTLKVDWPLLASVDRLQLLVNDRLFRLEFVGQEQVGWRDFLRLRDLRGRRAGARFFYYLGREAAHDFISLTRKNGLLDWLRFVTVMLGLITAYGGLIAFLLSRIF